MAGPLDERHVHRQLAVSVGLDQKNAQPFGALR